MLKKLNNKGYMLVEIVLASALAMGVAFFITELTINLKNKNDDLLVKTLVYTDQAIIYNTLMREIYEKPEEFSCSKISINGNIFKYGTFTNVVTEYATLGPLSCSYASNEVLITIPIKVKQLPDDNFDVLIYKTKIIQ